VSDRSATTQRCVSPKEYTGRTDASQAQASIRLTRDLTDHLHYRSRGVHRTPEYSVHTYINKVTQHSYYGSLAVA
jgi:predicted DNA-binding protein